MTVLDISGTGYLLTPRSTASRKVPKKFFSEMVAAVLYGDTGELLEYRHLMKTLSIRRFVAILFEMK